MPRFVVKLERKRTITESFDMVVDCQTEEEARALATPDFVEGALWWQELDSETVSPHEVVGVEARS